MAALCRSSELRLPDGVTDLIKHTGAETLSELVSLDDSLSVSASLSFASLFSDCLCVCALQVALSEDTVDMIFQHAGKGNVDFNLQLELSGARSRLKMFQKKFS